MNILARLRDVTLICTAFGLMVVTVGTSLRVIQAADDATASLTAIAAHTQPPVKTNVVSVDPRVLALMDGAQARKGRR